MEWFIPVEIFWKKSNTFRGTCITFFTFLPKRPKFSVPFVWITSAGLQVERKRKIYWYFVSGTTQSRSCFRCQKKYQDHLTEIFHRNFCTNGKRQDRKKANPPPQATSRPASLAIFFLFVFSFFFRQRRFFSPSCHNAEPGFGTKNEERKSKTARKVGRVKERGGVGKSFSFPSPSPLFHFFALPPFFARPTSKIPFLGIFLFRTQTEMLATQATEFQTSTITSRRTQ